ncbi:MAG: hypothetical protein WCW67_07585 [Candidatus Margulisiibacteriota bacterium]|jgi:hypothetical protein
MGIVELEFSFECLRRNVITKIKTAKERWQEAWDKYRGDAAAEAELVAIKLEIQLQEKEAATELLKIRNEIERQKKLA